MVLLGRYNGQGFGDVLQNVVKRVMVKTSDASSVANEGKIVIPLLVYHLL